MTDKTEPKTFDLIAALQGRTYPKETVILFLDESMMYNYSKARKDSDQDPNSEEKQKIADEMAEQFKGAALKVTIQGIPAHVHKAIRDTVVAEHPIQYDGFGRAKADADFTEMFDQLLWENYVTQIEAPDGSTLTPNSADIRALRREAPQSAIDAIIDAINAMSEGTRSGYEQIVQEPGFLSQP